MTEYCTDLVSSFFIGVVAILLLFLFEYIRCMIIESRLEDENKDDD